MVKRLFQIAVLTGSAHVFTLLVLSFLSKNTSPATLTKIGEIDSTFQLLINLLGFGLQLSAVRHIALSGNWKIIYYETQRARITLGLLMMPVALFAFINSSSFLFLLAPVFALSGDFALYGRGQPVKAAIWAFCRVFIPASLLLLVLYINKSYLPHAYILSTLLVYWLTGVAIARQLRCQYIIRPSLPSLKLYLQNIGLGISTLAIYVLGLGLMFIASFFYNENVLAVSYLGLKIYVVLKGMLRIINQSFVKEMIKDEMTLKADQLSILAGVSCFGATLLFPKTILILFIGEQYAGFTSFLILISLSVLITCIFTSFHNRSLFKKKDKMYAQYAAVAAIMAIILVIIFSYFLQKPESIALALLTGELIFAIGLIHINSDAAILSRIKFLGKAFLNLIPAVVIQQITGDSPSGFWIGTVALIAMAAFFNYKKLLFPATDKHSYH